MGRRSRKSWATFEFPKPSHRIAPQRYTVLKAKLRRLQYGDALCDRIRVRTERGSQYIRVRLEYTAPLGGFPNYCLYVGGMPRYCLHIRGDWQGDVLDVKRDRLAVFLVEIGFSMASELKQEGALCWTVRRGIAKFPFESPSAQAREAKRQHLSKVRRAFKQRQRTEMQSAQKVGLC